jgi:ATP/maltotriose-dependent transcriptional regulator MalT
VSAHENLTAHTRFAVPHIPNATLIRHALMSRLDAGSDCALTLVAAAPGSGKSALLAQWVGTLPGPVAWLSCDIDDADPVWFWRDVRAAVRHSWLGAPLGEVELVEQREPRQLAIELANDLVDLDPGVIVVDDFHLAAPGPAAMIAFIDALPPTVQLVLGSREDPVFPLSRMRVQGRLLELRQADLKFTIDEIEQLFADLGVHLSPAELGRLADLTEGWAVGVHLAGLSLRAVPEPDKVLARLVDTDRNLVDYLMNEVIELQSPEMQDFLVVTGELEAFDAALCDAVTGRTDCAQLLEHIRAANLFLVGLDGEGHWYRYHHLFTEFLRARLRATSAARVSVIHRTAADAFAERGDLLSAVRQCLLAGDTDAALGHLANHMATTSLTDQSLGGVVARAWLDEHGAGHLATDPIPILECVLALDATQSREAAEHWLERVQANEARLDHTSQFMLDGVWSFHHLCEGDPAAALERARQAQATLQQHLIKNKWVPSLSLMLIQAQLWLDDLQGAMATIDSIRADPDAPALFKSVRLPGYASQIAMLNGDLHAAAEFATLSETGADQLGLPARAFGRAEPALAFTEIAIENNHLDRAEAHLDQLMRIVDHGRRPLLEMTGQLILARLASARGDDSDVALHLQQARQAVPNATAVVVAHIDRVELRHALRSDGPNVEPLLQRLPPSPQTDLLAARVRLASEDHEGAQGFLSRTPILTTPRLQIEHGILSAMATAQSDTSLAQPQLQDALTLAEASGFQQSVVNEGPRLWTLLKSLPTRGRLGEYVARLLSAADGVVPPPRAPNQDTLIEPLSDRELTVLRYLASKLNGTEIADTLYVSVNTVRSHIKAIYRKLGVNNRAEAVRHGESLGLI